MATHTLSTDYLVVGAGAMGMSFVEELVYNNPRVEIIIIDNRAAPGGHWNNAYSFVCLHQHACTYMESTPGLLELVEQIWRQKHRSCSIMSWL